MRALKIQSPNHAAVQDVPIPSLRSPDHVIVRPVAVALNPTDWKHITWVKTHPTVGCDFAGVVESVGDSPAKAWKKGDRVWGFTHGSNSVQEEDGAFGEYLISKSGLLGRVPDNMSFEDASTLGVATLTVGQGMYQEMDLPWPGTQEKVAEDKKPWFLIYGGSSAMGAFGIQFAKLSGFRVVATCSPRNFSYVKSLGADAVFDYSSPTCGADIRAHTSDSLYYVWDCIGENGSYEIGATALASSAPAGQKLHYGTILFPNDPPRADVDFTWSLGYTASGEAFEMGDRKFEAKPDHYEFMKKWLDVAENLILEGKVQPHQIDKREGGLDSILGGLEDMKNGKVSGVKIVYRVQEP
ncbi:GroES-like protein [Polyplosphaeria fusca]|uniref:GroES-like protein n=1 Tax=Polyplosphaeria fusca TaxID=682080 RepID=A0A9P4V308_9PLEO|nr:GroES-like protein [Polyplosphaeria fusca]